MLTVAKFGSFVLITAKVSFYFRSVESRWTKYFALVSFFP